MAVVSYRKTGLRRTIPPLVVIVVLLGLWQLYVMVSGVPKTILPSPSGVIAAGAGDIERLSLNVVPTLTETLIGFALSITVAWIFATACDFWPMVRRGIEPLMVASQTIPIVAIAPLFIIWFGFSITPKIIVVALVTFFPVTIALLQGFVATPAEATSLLRSLGASRWQSFITLRVPTALPFFFSGLKISITYAVVGAIFGEYVGSQSGLGIYMQIAQNSRQTDLVLAAVAVTALLSLLLYSAVVALERVALPWARVGSRS